MVKGVTFGVASY